MRNLLLVFVKNPELGKVKSRLAKYIGDKKALSVYLKLLNHTKKVVVDLKIDKRICYSDSIIQHDMWEFDKFQKMQQTGDDLGTRMFNSLDTAFKEKYSKICLIGSDLLELTQDVIEESFRMLDDHDLVVGPARDGGYYLIGMKSPKKELFENKAWGTETVL